MGRIGQVIVHVDHSGRTTFHHSQPAIIQTTFVEMKNIVEGCRRADSRIAPPLQHIRSNAPTILKTTKVPSSRNHPGLIADFQQRAVARRRLEPVHVHDLSHAGGVARPCVCRRFARRDPGRAVTVPVPWRGAHRLPPAIRKSRLSFPPSCQGRRFCFQIRRLAARLHIFINRRNPRFDSVITRRAGNLNLSFWEKLLALNRGHVQGK